MSILGEQTDKSHRTIIRRNNDVQAYLLMWLVLLVLLTKHKVIIPAQYLQLLPLTLPHILSFYFSLLLTQTSNKDRQNDIKRFHIRRMSIQLQFLKFLKFLFVFVVVKLEWWHVVHLCYVECVHFWNAFCNLSISDPRLLVSAPSVIES